MHKAKSEKPQPCYWVLKGETRARTQAPLGEVRDKSFYLVEGSHQAIHWRMLKNPTRYIFVLESYCTKMKDSFPSKK